MEDAPDLTDDTFLLASRAAAYAPRMLLTPALLPPLLDAALVRVCRVVLPSAMQTGWRLLMIY